MLNHGGMQRLTLLLSLTVFLATGCYTRRSVLTQLPSAVQVPAAGGSRGDIAVTGRTATVIESMQDPATELLWVPRGELEAVGTIRATPWSAVRPIFNAGFSQGALTARGAPPVAGYAGDQPTLAFGPGFAFRIEPDDHLNIDIEADPLFGLIVESVEYCDADFTECFASDDDYVLVPVPQGAVTLGYEFERWGSIHGGLAVVTQPTSAESLGDPIAIPILRVGGALTPVEGFEILMDVQWPFYSELATYAPTVSLGVRGAFGSIDPPDDLPPPAPGRDVYVY